MFNLSYSISLRFHSTIIIISVLMCSTLSVCLIRPYKLKLSHYTPWKRLGGEVCRLMTWKSVLFIPNTAAMGLWGGGGRYSSYSFSTSAIEGGEWSASRLDHALVPGKGPPGTHCTAGWVCPRAGLDTETREKILSPLPRIEPQLPGRTACIQTLY
jgi:hypothetical protein